jgi:hypothetical protein
VATGDVIIKAEGCPLTAMNWQGSYQNATIDTSQASSVTTIAGVDGVLFQQNGYGLIFPATQQLVFDATKKYTVTVTED